MRTNTMMRTTHAFLDNDIDESIVRQRYRKLHEITGLTIRAEFAYRKSVLLTDQHKVLSQRTEKERIL